MKEFVKHKKKLYIIIPFIVFIIVGAMGINNIFSRKKLKPKAVNGIVDLSEWDLMKDGIIELDGTWEFYWNRLLTPENFKNENNLIKTGVIEFPGTWNGLNVNDHVLTSDGHGTYRLLIKKEEKNDILSLYIPIINCSHKLWVNNNLMSTVGVVGKNKDEIEIQRKENIVNFKDDSENIEIILQISNYDSAFKGGPNGSIILGNYKQIQSYVYKNNAVVWFVFGSLFIMAFYHFGLYLLRRKDKSPLYFGILCLCAALREILYSEVVFYELFPNIDWILKGKGQCLVTELSFLMFLMFIDSIYKEYRKTKIYNAIKYFMIILIIFYLLVPIKILGNTQNIFIFVAMVICFYTFYSVLKAFIHKKEGATIVIIGMSLLFITVTNDFLYNNHIIYTGYYASLGLVSFIFAQSFMLSRKFSKAFNTVEALSEKLISLDKLKDEFLANTTHELRTPLNGIVGISESLLDDSSNLNQHQINNISLIVSSGRRLSKLINDILDFSKLKNKDITLNKKSVDINQIVNVVLEVSNNLIENKKIELISTISEEIPYVFVDENRFEQILYNLIGNAIKNTYEGKIIVSACCNNNMVEISVSDTGIGIPEEKFGQIFKAFEQLEVTGNNKGIGLGLSITKRFIELHGGEIKVKSQLNKGSKFTFTLPVSKEKNAIQILPQNNGALNKINTVINNKHMNSSESKNSNDGEFKILVVDDDLINRQVIINNFSSSKYSIISASDGEEALKKLSKHKDIDLIVLDVMMPKMSGYEVCREIRKKYSLIELPVVLLTASEKTEVIEVGFKVGANDYLFKPVDKAELTARVNTLLELKKSVEQAVTSELCFLQAQIKPHFLFNALNTIMSFCRTNPERARELLLDLSNYLRKSFDFNNKEKFVSLENEMSFVKSYLAIEKARFSKRLNIIYDIEPNLNCLMPPLILQPLVENAVRHGIASKRQGGMVKISAKGQNEFVLIKVEDDGIGIDKERLNSILNKTIEGSVGMKNIIKRLDIIYGYGIDIQTEQDKGTTISLKIPLRKEKFND
ncbi:ATP-binding protein [Oceanirhabdus seepicola]|uniref:Stage 0 sporulation protein A homolog n=1 Tax=Oceanirhabdus seepicola TaxID=2828781 RepID=A0A9J6P085_9CLOT|nr:ATP-binding protein [Oceanirhabdus seepicola]MCM1989947.1 response regulator [Oceanirhabdus seepicola]